jgi:hypothetical protein
MNEWLMILTMTLCSALFAIGGTKGKFWRRYGIPLLLGGIALYCHEPWYNALGLALTLIVALSLGYGTNSPYWKKAITFSLYGLSFLWIGWSWWIILTPILCLLIFWLSNQKPTAHPFFWKACEFLYGTFLAITFLDAIK